MARRRSRKSPGKIEIINQNDQHNEYNQKEQVPEGTDDQAIRNKANKDQDDVRIAELAGWVVQLGQEAVQDIASTFVKETLQTEKNQTQTNTEPEEQFPPLDSAKKRKTSTSPNPSGKCLRKETPKSKHPNRYKAILPQHQQSNPKDTRNIRENVT